MDIFSFLKLASSIFIISLFSLSPWWSTLARSAPAVSPCLFVSPPVQPPVTPTEAMRLANQNYETGNYTEAIAIYEAIIEAGLHNSDVYYNLGNAYFKQGDLGRAILNYRRAQRLAPRDADVIANLNVAQAQTVDKLEVPTEETWSNLIKPTEKWLTIPETAFLTLVLWVLIGVLVVVVILKPAIRRWCLITIGVLAIFLIIGLLSLADRYYTELNYPLAVVVAPQVDVTSGPGSAGQYVVEFTLHSGTEVSLLESRPGWKRITLPGDLQGWAPDEAIEQISE